VSPDDRFRIRAKKLRKEGGNRLITCVAGDDYGVANQSLPPRSLERASLKVFPPCFWFEQEKIGDGRLF
jgi:hypothetical protein